LIREIKGADWEATAVVKAQPSHRWCASVTATNWFGHWDFALVKRVPDLAPNLDTILEPAAAN
jgi:hypothetical protein